MAPELRSDVDQPVPEVSPRNYHRSSPYPVRLRVRHLIWELCRATLYRWSPRPMHGWRAMLLRSFGAKLGPDCHFYPGSKIWAPWNLECADQVTAGDDAELFNPAPLQLGSHAVVSQGALLCGAVEDFDDPELSLRAYPMRIGPYAWVCARACVAPGVSLGEGAVLGLASTATRDLEPWVIYAGSPAIKIRERRRPASREDHGTDLEAQESGLQRTFSRT